jgi:hypothetical protein
MSKLIGRKEEQQELRRLYDSDKAEFLAVYGRRRVGKTYLINQFFERKGIFFEITGTPEASTKEQLISFHREYCALFKREDGLPPPKTWSEAFHRLGDTCRQLHQAERIILFFDELPWLASPRSGFLQALDYFWNRHGSRIPNLLLIVCGSAAWWMLNKVINAKGGLYGRLSADLRLLPFTLDETEQFLESRKIQLPRKQICELYMSIGGVPKYLDYLSKGKSVAQLIDQLCFTPRAPLLKEYHRLYSSLFENSAIHSTVIQTLAFARRDGLTRTELVKKVPRLQAGGSATRVLKELEECGFIGVFPAFGKKTRDQLYRLTDEYSLFYFQWIDPVKSQILQSSTDNHWLTTRGKPAWQAWAGKAFESLCLKHVIPIKRALGIGGVATSVYHWYERATSKGESGAEIDLVIDRADSCINLCELKFCDKEYVVSKEYAAKLEAKKRSFRQHTGTNKALMTTLITPYSFVGSAYAKEAIDASVDLNSLF